MVLDRWKAQHFPLHLSSWGVAPFPTGNPQERNSIRHYRRNPSFFPFSESEALWPVYTPLFRTYGVTLFLCFHKEMAHTIAVFALRP